MSHLLKAAAHTRIKTFLEHKQWYIQYAELASFGAEFINILLNRITDESLKSSAFAGIAEQMGEEDPLAAAKFIDANPTLATDDVYEEFMWNVRREDPVLGANAIGSMQNTDRQSRAYRQYLGHWLRRDYDAAVNWVGQNELPQNVQRSVDAMIKRMQEQEQAPAPGR